VRRDLRSEARFLPLGVTVITHVAELITEVT
jgi:hypothetical protein